jgi:hypothetical protein
MALLTIFEIRLSNLLARKFQNYNIYIDSIEKIWQKSLVRQVSDFSSISSQE